MFLTPSLECREKNKVLPKKKKKKSYCFCVKILDEQGQNVFDDRLSFYSAN